MISVVIVTRNRSDAIASISLPSLLRQDITDFEVFVWDASDDDSTERAVLQFKLPFEQKGVPLFYRRGARQYLASTRNDSVREAQGDVIFFLDDDAEISSDGLNAIKRYFGDFAWLRGMGLPLHDVHPRLDKYVAHPFFGALRDLVFRFFFGKPPRYRKIMNSTRNIVPTPDPPGIAEWLTGACMAYRKSVFDDLSFDEGIERFGGYAFGEDYDFSHRVWLRYGEPLLISISGFVAHHNAQTARIPKGPDKAAAIYYNTARIRDSFMAYRPYKLPPFLWELRIGLTLSLLMQRMGPLDLMRGYVKSRRAMHEDRSRMKDKSVGIMKGKLISFILPSLVGGGVERVVVNLANQFARNGYPVDIVLWSGSVESPYSEDIDDSVNVISIRGPQRQYNLLVKGLVALFSLKKLIKYITQASPSVIFASTCEHVVILANELTKNKSKLVVMIHSDPSFHSALKMQGGRKGRLFFFRMLSKLLYPKVDKVVGVSKGIADFMIKDGVLAQEKIRFIYNPVATSALIKKSKEEPTHKWLLNKTRPVFIGVGRLSPEKNFALLLKAFKLVIDKIDAVLLILGEGPLLNELKKLSMELGIEPRVDFMGFTKNPFSILTNSDVLVLTSDTEGFSNVIIEALACGCQIVSTNCPHGPAEILENGKYGGLTPVGDKIALAEAMLRAISEPIDRISLQERAKDFDEKIISRQYIALAEELTGGESP